MSVFSVSFYSSYWILTWGSRTCRHHPSVWQWEHQAASVSHVAARRFPYRLSPASPLILQRVYFCPPANGGRVQKSLCPPSSIIPASGESRASFTSAPWAWSRPAAPRQRVSAGRRLTWRSPKVTSAPLRWTPAPLPPHPFPLHATRLNCVDLSRRAACASTVASVSLPTGWMSCGIKTDTRSTRRSRAVRFTPSASAPTGSAATLSTTTRRKWNLPSPAPPPLPHRFPQAFPSSHLPPSARTDHLLSGTASASPGFPLPPSQPFSLPFPPAPLPLLPSRTLRRPRFPPARILPISFLMPSWRWTLPLRPPPRTSTSPPWARPPQRIPGLHSCPHRTPAVLRVVCLRRRPLPWGRAPTPSGCFRGRWAHGPCPTPLCLTRTRMEAALPARSVALNPAEASTRPTADVWLCSVSSLFLRMLLASAFRPQCAVNTNMHFDIYIYYIFSDTHLQAPTSLRNICWTRIYSDSSTHDARTLEPYTCAYTHTAAALTRQCSPVRRQRKPKDKTYWLNQKAERDLPVRVMWFISHFHMRKGSDNAAPEMSVATKTEFRSRRKLRVLQANDS